MVSLCVGNYAMTFTGRGQNSTPPHRSSRLLWDGPGLSPSVLPGTENWLHQVVYTQVNNTTRELVAITEFMVPDNLKDLMTFTEQPCMI